MWWLSPVWRGFGFSLNELQLTYFMYVLSKLFSQLLLIVMSLSHFPPLMYERPFAACWSHSRARTPFFWNPLSSSWVTLCDPSESGVGARWERRLASRSRLSFWRNRSPSSWWRVWQWCWPCSWGLWDQPFQASSSQTWWRWALFPNTVGTSQSNAHCTVQIVSSKSDERPYKVSNEVFYLVKQPDICEFHFWELFVLFLQI